jgi:hypothetical protein
LASELKDRKQDANTMLPAQRTVTLTYTPSLVRQSVWAFWKRSVGITWPLTLVLLTAYVVLLVRGGNTGWLVGVFGTIVALGYIYLAAVYVAHLRHGMATLRAMGSPHGTLEVEDSGITVASGAGQSKLPWSRVQEVWFYPGFWILLFSRTQFMTLPLDNLPEAMQAEILERVRQQGGKTH